MAYALEKLLCEQYIYVDQYSSEAYRALVQAVRARF